MRRLVVAAAECRLALPKALSVRSLSLGTLLRSFCSPPLYEAFPARAPLPHPSTLGSCLPSLPFASLLASQLSPSILFRDHGSSRQICSVFAFKLAARGRAAWTSVVRATSRQEKASVRRGRAATAIAQRGASTRGHVLRVVTHTHQHVASGRVPARLPASWRARGRGEERPGVRLRGRPVTQRRAQNAACGGLEAFSSPTRRCERSREGRGQVGWRERRNRTAVKQPR